MKVKCPICGHEFIVFPYSSEYESRVLDKVVCPLALMPGVVIDYSIKCLDCGATYISSTYITKCYRCGSRNLKKVEIGSF